MPELQTSRISCGVYQLYNLNTAAPTILRRIMAGYKYQASSQGRRNGFAQIIFSDNVSSLNPNGLRFAAYLRELFPNSDLVELKAKRSPSTGNNIQTWIWNIPHVAFKRHPFYAKVKPLRHYRNEYL